MSNVHDPSRRPPGLGPHLVGQRVVVRRVVPGETGPTGGPAFTDALGVMESWDGGVTTVRTASGAVVAIPVADIVSGKPVPPRPSVRHRVTAEAAETLANASWPALETRWLGSWLLRASAGFSSRANSVMAVGDPVVPFQDAVAAVEAFYADRGLPAWAQVVVGSDEDRAFADAGWVLARPGEADTHFQIASVSRALRSASTFAAELSAADVAIATADADNSAATRSTTVGPAWLANDARALAHGQHAVAVLEGPEEVCFVTVGDRAKGRAGGAAPGGPGGDWVGITDIWVAPEHRRRGLAVVVVRELLEWAAERGVTTAYLQTRGDNPGALALYDRLGFVTHHTYRYLTPPA